MAKIFVIAGHGAGDSGAVGNGYTEAERVRALASKIKDLGGNNVTLGDFSRNYYADNGITKLNISKDYKIVELHMDSASSSARGGHVIIKSGYNADSYDMALAKSISAILPGRASSIVKRSDLANPNRAAAKGYNYRLIENGFITNAQDVKIFNSRMDEIAKEILNDFGIRTVASVSESVDGNVVSGGVSQNEKNTFGTVSYCGHLRGTGWAAWQCDGAMIGSTGQNRRIEAIKLDCDDSPDVVVHLKDIGDKEYKSVSKDTIIGTTGENRRIEAIKITGKKRFYMYRVHQKDLGWSSWANNGEWAGVRGQGKQVEAIEIKESMFSVNPHVQNDGWLGEKAAENIIGITGHGLRLEALKINPRGKQIKAKVHLQNDGWVDYGVITKDTVIGTTGEKKRIECICFEGDFEYRVHVQNSGWTDWTKADGVSTLGTVGQSLRIEAIQFRKIE